MNKIKSFKDKVPTDLCDYWTTRLVWYEVSINVSNKFPFIHFANIFEFRSGISLF